MASVLTRRLAALAARRTPQRHFASIPDSFDTVICGGAAAGSSAAYFLATMRNTANPSILVIEKDTSYAKSATALCAASFRTQFSTPENIRMSLFGAHFFKNVNKYLAVGDNTVDLQVREHGYLFLGAKDNAVGLQHLKENIEVQRAEGASIATLTQAELAQKYPWMSTGDLELVRWANTTRKCWPFEGDQASGRYSTCVRAFGSEG
jgi:glycine/D-amino acid oxidase-like deaminating enzyme